MDIDTFAEQAERILTRNQEHMRATADLKTALLDAASSISALVQSLVDARATSRALAGALVEVNDSGLSAETNREKKLGVHQCYVWIAAIDASQVAMATICDEMSEVSEVLTAAEDTAKTDRL